MRDGVERRHALAAATPSIWPVAGWLSSSYGTRKDPVHRTTPTSIPVSTSPPTTASRCSPPADATVSGAGANGAYGNMVTLDHGFGIVTKYGHLSRIARHAPTSTSSAAT